MKAGRQTTLRQLTAVSGVGVHSGAPATLTMLPAEADTGIVFIRCGVDGQPDREIRANVRAVTATEFATVLGDATGPLCSTAEHVLAALSGLGVDNAVIEIDGPEVPIMDGSSAPFVEAIDKVGLITLPVPRRYIRILKPVRVTKADCYGELRPHPQGFRVELDIDFAHPLIGRQSVALDIEPETFRRELARARTFGFMKDVAKLWSAGYALGASFENTLVINEQRLLNPEGLRFAVLFSYAQGHKIQNYSNGTHFEIGKLMAQIHGQTNNLEQRRITYATDTLLNQSLENIRQFLPDKTDEMQFLIATRPLLEKPTSALKTSLQCTARWTCS